MGYSKSPLSEVEVVQPERLLVDRRVLLARQGEHGLAVVEHVVAADLVGSVGEPVRDACRSPTAGAAWRCWLLRTRAPRRPRRTARSRRRARRRPRGRRRAGRRSSRSASTSASVSSVTFGCSSAGRTPHHLRIRLAVHRAWEAVAVHAAHARAVRHVGLVEQDPAGRVERMVAGRGEIVGELLDARLVRHRRARVRRARGRLGRILTTRAVHLVELLGQRVVRLHLLVGDRPCGRDAIVVAQLAEVLLAQAVERRAVELGGAPDEVVHLRLRRASRARRTTCRARRTCSRRTRPARASCWARAAATRRVRAAARACPSERGGARGCRLRRRCR